MTLTTVRSARAPSEDAWRRRELPTLPGSDRAGIDEHLHRLRFLSMRLQFQRNDILFGEGDAASHIYTMVSGCVRLCRHVKDGRRHISDFMFAGDSFGLGERTTYALAAEAVDPVTVTACPRTYFEQLGEANTRLRSDLLAHFAERLTVTRHHLFVVSCQNAKERLASFLVRMCLRNNLCGDKVEVPMGRKDIADHLGLTIETICRAIAALKKDGIVDVLNVHQFIVKDMEALQALSQGSR